CSTMQFVVGNERNYNDIVIKGYVIDEKSSLGIKAKIKIANDSYTWENETSDDGYYEFLVSGENFTITAYANNYKSLTVTINATADKQVKWVNLSLEPILSTIQGFVFDKDAKPIIGAKVLLDGFSALTNDSGYYIFKELYKGRYELTVNMDGYLSNSKSLILELNESREENLTLNKLPLNSAKVWGYVFSNDTNLPVGGVELRLFDIESSAWVGNETTAGGYFFISTYPGYFNLFLRHKNYMGYRDSFGLEEGEKKYLEIKLKEKKTDIKLFGYVKNEKNDTIENVELRIEDADTGDYSTTLSNKTGFYSFTTYKGKFNLEAKKESYFTYFDKIVLEDFFEKNISLIKVPEKSAHAWGYLREKNKEPIKDGEIIVYDINVSHGKYRATAISGIGGYYNIPIYKGSFIIIGKANGYKTNIKNLDVNTDYKKFDMELEKISDEERTIGFTFLNLNVLRLEVNITIGDPMGLRWQIDQLFGNGNGVVEKDEEEKYKNNVFGKGVEVKTTDDFLLTNNYSYGYTANTYSLSILNSDKELTSADEIYLVKRMDYLCKGDVSKDNVVMKTNITQSKKFKYTFSLLQSYQLINWSGENISVEGKGKGRIFITPIGTGYDWIELNISKNVKPEVIISPSKNYVKMGENVTFDATDSKDDVGIMNYTWDFGDGSYGEGAIVTHNFTIPPESIDKGYKNYTVTLNITDTLEEWNTGNVTIVVDNKPPKAIMTPFKTTVNEDNETVEFNGTNSTDNVGIEKYNWDFGDGYTGEGIVSSHTYRKPGFYNVTLNVTDKAGHSANISLLIEVIDITLPTPIITMPINGSIFKIDETIEFNGTESKDDDDLPIVNYTWDFDDGTIAYENITNHTYSAPGTYNITLNVTDASGLKASANVTIIITPKELRPDLTPKKIELSKDVPMEGEKVKITAKIENVGDVKSESIIVRFYVDEDKIGEKKIDKIEANSSAKVSIDWSPKRGEHKIKVRVDPDKKISENNEENNTKEIKVKVGESMVTIAIVIASVIVLICVIAGLWYIRRPKKEEIEFKQKKK
ncbi:MAG: PKD domain-containing protein, partial [Candidatus Thermoplasmatota archaeon]